MSQIGTKPSGLAEGKAEEDQRWMQYALTLAERAAESGEVPVGAVLVKDGKILSEGWNQPISTHDPTAHAEIVVLRQAALTANNYRLPGTTLYVTLEPCTMCVGAIVHARVGRLVFGASEPKAGAVISQNSLFEHPAMNCYVQHEGGICADACGQILSDFFSHRREVKKAEKRQVLIDKEQAGKA